MNRSQKEMLSCDRCGKLPVSNNMEDLRGEKGRDVGEIDYSYVCLIPKIICDECSEKQKIFIK